MKKSAFGTILLKTLKSFKAKLIANSLHTYYLYKVLGIRFGSIHFDTIRFGSKSSIERSWNFLAGSIGSNRIQPATYPSRPSDPMNFKQKRLLTQVRFESNYKNLKKKFQKRSKFVWPNFFRIFDSTRFVSFRFDSIKLVSFTVIEFYSKLIPMNDWIFMQKCESFLLKRSSLK